ncbi:hypothetical protein [Ferruginibacter sp.]
MSSSKFPLLSSYMADLAESAEFIIRTKYKLGKAIIDEEISPNVGWRPTLLWKTKEMYIACEVSERPNPPVLVTACAEIINLGLPVKMISAFPIEHSLSLSIYQSEKTKVKSFGIGLLPVDSNKVGSFEHYGIPVTLHLPCPTMKTYHKSIHKAISTAYDIYLTDPPHGVQELGQVIEKILIDLADQAKTKGKLTKGSFKNKETYVAQNILIDDLIAEKITDKALLKKCSAFADDRNSVSHKPKTIAESKKLLDRIKEQFKTGLFILEDLPEKMKHDKYIFNY